MVILGITITAATALALAAESIRRKRFSFPGYGWLGVTLLIAAELMMFRHIRPVDVFFTAIAWTAYLLIADALVFAMRGRSRLHDCPRELLHTALLSIFLWLIFERLTTCGWRTGPT